jgi:hypothetical protein
MSEYVAPGFVPAVPPGDELLPSAAVAGPVTGQAGTAAGAAQAVRRAALEHATTGGPVVSAAVAAALTGVQVTAGTIMTEPPVTWATPVLEPEMRVCLSCGITAPLQRMFDAGYAFYCDDIPGCTDRVAAASHAASTRSGPSVPAGVTTAPDAPPIVAGSAADEAPAGLATSTSAT